MPHDKPKYLANQLKERSGVYTIVAIAAVLAIALFAAWQLYIGTVIGWEKRFDPARDSAVPIGNTPPPVPREMATDAKLAEQNLRQLSEARHRSGGLPHYDKCINGTAFKRLPEGGWENLKGVRC